MDKKTFLQELSKALAKLPNKEKQVLIDFYSELIDDKIECGQSEAEVVASFGSINVLAERLLIENPNRKKNGCLYWIVGALVVMVLGFLMLFLNVSNTQTTAKSDNNLGVPAQDNTNNSNLTQGDYLVVSYDYNDVDEISLDSDLSEIIVQKSSDTNINIRYKEYSGELNSFGLRGRTLEFDNEQKTNIPNKKSEHTIYLEIPDEFNGYLDVGAGLGAIKMNGFDLTKIDLSTDLGTVEIADCTAIDIDLSSDLGSVTVKNTVAEHSFEASSEMGVVDFTGIDGAIIDISTDMGAIKGDILGRQEDYSISSEVGMGKSNLQNQSGGSKKLLVSTDMGSIDISFGK